MKTLLATPKTRLRKHPERGSYELALIEQILDEGLVCQLGFIDDSQPFVVPLAYARRGRHVYLHAASHGRLARVLSSGAPVCFTVTIVDGLVLARSAMSHSMNFRSVMVLGVPKLISDDAEKTEVLRWVVEHVVPGRADVCRAPTEPERRATAVWALAIEEASAKVRSGPPKDDAEDERWPCWAGVIPLGLVARPPISCGGPFEAPTVRPLQLSLK